jgi:hypothetical protein
MGYIYKIVINGETFIGATGNGLIEAQNHHNCSLRRPHKKQCKSLLYKYCRENNVKKIICELIEEVQVVDIRIPKQFYIDLLKPSLNSYKASQS